MAKILNDLVEIVHRKLVEDNLYVDLLNATYDELAVEGSLAADNFMAALMIRNKAKEMQLSDVYEEKLANIVVALNIVLRRYRADRKSRREHVKGDGFTMSEPAPFVIDNGAE